MMTKESSPMMMTRTGNASNLQCQEVGMRKQQGGEGAGCDMGLLSGFSLACLICEQTFCKRNNHDYHQASQKA